MEELLKTYTGKGTLAVAWTGPCPHSNPAERVVPDADAPDWVKAMVRAENTNHDNGIEAGIKAGTYWLVNGRSGAWPPAWVPGDPTPEKCRCAFGYMCQTISPGAVISTVRVTIVPDREPKFPLPKVRNFPGYGLAVSGPETTSSEQNVRAAYTIEVLEEAEYAPSEWVANGRNWPGKSKGCP